MKTRNQDKPYSLKVWKLMVARAQEGTWKLYGLERPVTLKADNGQDAWWEAADHIAIRGMVAQIRLA